MKRILGVILLMTSIIYIGCSEDEDATSSSTGLTGTYISSSLTCDGVTQSLGTVLFSLQFTASETAASLSGVSVSPASSCTGVFLLSGVSFSGGSYAYTFPGAATTCRDIDNNEVSSCDVGGVQCDTSSSDPGVSYAGTYTQPSSTQLVLTSTSTGESFCSSGQTEVLTLDLSE